MTSVNNDVRRNREIEEATNLYFIHPLSARLVPLLARAGVHPNTVSIAGALCGIAAGIAYYKHFIFLGFALMIAWHIFDGADGQLARLTNKTSPSGQVVDGACDYITFGAIYLAIALTLLNTHKLSVLILVVAAAASHAVQAAAFEHQREVYLSWRKMESASVADVTARMSSPATLAMRYYAWIQRPFLSLPPALKHDLMERAGRSEAAEIGAKYREVYRGSVKLWSILSANNRSIAIFIAFLLNWPEGYLWLEVVALNLMVVGLMRMNAASGKRLAVLTGEAA